MSKPDTALWIGLPDATELIKNELCEERLPGGKVT